MITKSNVPKLESICSPMFLLPYSFRGTAMIHLIDQPRNHKSAFIFPFHFTPNPIKLLPSNLNSTYFFQIQVRPQPFLTWSLPKDALLVFFPPVLLPSNHLYLRGIFLKLRYHHVPGSLK